MKNPTPTLDDFRAAGLYDPAVPEAGERLALLGWLREHGISLTQMIAGRANLQTLAGDLEVRPGERMTLTEASQRTGISAELLQRVRVASGLAPATPEDAVLTQADADTFADFVAASAIFGEPAMLQFMRVLGSSLARVAEAAITLFIVSVELPARATQASSVALAQANLAAAQTLGILPFTMETLFRAHIEAAISRQRKLRGERADLLAITVGFVDLVGFTPLARRLSAAELGALVERFEGLASDLTVARGGRLVKHVGDAVMFIAPAADVGCDIALSLLEQFADDEVVRPRGGLASGEVLMRGGDYYGPVVNLASRIGELAVPREILVTPAVADAARGAGYHFEPAGKRLLKGVDEPQAVYTATRPPRRP